MFALFLNLIFTLCTILVFSFMCTLIVHIGSFVFCTSANMQRFLSVPHWASQMAKSAGCLGWSVGDCLSPKDISGLRRPKNIKFGTKVHLVQGWCVHLDFLEKVFLFVAEFAEKCPKLKFSQNTHRVAPCICGNSIYVAPPCEWILHMLPQTAWSTEDPVMIRHLTGLIISAIPYRCLLFVHTELDCNRWPRQQTLLCHASQQKSCQSAKEFFRSSGEIRCTCQLFVYACHSGFKQWVFLLWMPFFYVEISNFHFWTTFCNWWSLSSRVSLALKCLHCAKRAEH